MESRLKKSLTAGGRDDRASEDATRKAPEEKFMSSQERRKMWSDEWTQSALPKVPDIPGYHTCWLSTTNSYDTIDKRIRLGYTPVTTADLPGFENHRVKSGAHEGQISCNEMLLFKLPMELYQDAMRQMHYEAPRDEAEKIKVQLDNLQGTRDSSGRSLLKIEGEGMSSIDKQQATNAPVFEG